MPGVGGRWLGDSLANKMPTLNNHALLASAARVASGNSGNLVGYAPYTSATFTLTISADESTSADLLDVYIQRLLPDNTTYEDIVHFTQALGNAGNTGVQDIADVYAGASAGIFDATPNDGTMAVGVADLQWGDVLRVKWVIVDDSASASFTFKIDANFRV